MMHRRVTPLVLLALFIGILVLGPSLVEAQPPAQDRPVVPADREVLARGPVHEAFGEPTSIENTSSPIVPKEPPAPVEEQVPDKKPSGGNFSWIPGYWSWDEQGKDFVWVAGIWRIAPPGRNWMPGSWHKVEDGWQWSSGYWSAEDKEETEYLAAPPPATKETGPAYAAPDTLASYVPGHWASEGGKYAWQSGFWAAYRPGWVWIPASYRRTRAGYIYVPGYWDMPLLSRGLIYAPVRFRVVGRRVVTYQPVYVMEPDFLIGALFVKKGTRTFYFGDWFDPVYGDSYITWVRYYQGTRRRFLDADFKYYRVTTVAMKMSNWEKKLVQLYDRRAKGLLARPPITLDRQKRALGKIADGTEHAPVTTDLNLSHLKSARAMRSSAITRGFEITYLSSLAHPKTMAEVKYPIREVEQIEKLSPKERQQIEQQLRRYRILARARADAEARHATDRSKRTTPLVHKLELPPGTPPERKFLPPPEEKRSGKSGTATTTGGGRGATFHRRQGAPPPNPRPKTPPRKR
jgi:hypothetical protein